MLEREKALTKEKEAAISIYIIFLILHFFLDSRNILGDMRLYMKALSMIHYSIHVINIVLYQQKIFWFFNYFF